MPVNEITDGKNRGRLVDSDDLEASEFIAKILNKKFMPKATSDKLCRYVDSMIDDDVIRGQSKNKLVWLKTASLLGDSSNKPKHKVDSVWEDLEKLFQGKTLLKAIGTFVMWRLSLRGETWLLVRQDLGNVDPDTGKKILICTYWIDATYVLPKKPTISSLASKWGARTSESRPN